MILKSLHAKLVAIYIIIVVIFIAGLGVTLSVSYSRHLTQMRNDEIVDCAEQIAEMYAQGELAIIDLEDGNTIPVLKTTAKDFDATIQIVNTTSRRVFYNMNEEELTVYQTNKIVNNEIYDTVYGRGEVYIHSDYYNEEMDADVSTIAYPIRMVNSPVNEKPWAILIINSDLSNVKSTYVSIVSKLWLPAIIITALGLFIAVMLVGGIVKRVKVLNDATKKIAHGNFNVRVNFKQDDEIGQLAAGFNKMAEELAISDASKRDFVSNAAHELRSPMTSINGFVEGMLDGTIPEEKHRMYLEIVSSEVKRLTKLVKSMLDLSRIESGKDKLSLQKTDINELIRRVIIRLSQKIESKGIIPEINITDGKMFVLADPDKIEEVLQNLTDNAIKFTNEGKKIIFSCEKKEKKVYVSIKDEGAGISDEDIKFIWDRFYTVDKAHTGHKSGTGLGLAIVKNIIEQHEQQICVKSKVGEGTEFLFTLEYVSEE